jgi:hypothetical protein
VMMATATTLSSPSKKPCARFLRAWTRSHRGDPPGVELAGELARPPRRAAACPGQPTSTRAFDAGRGAIPLQYKTSNFVTTV